MDLVSKLKDKFNPTNGPISMTVVTPESILLDAEGFHIGLQFQSNTIQALSITNIDFSIYLGSVNEQSTADNEIAKTAYAEATQLTPNMPKSINVKVPFKEAGSVGKVGIHLDDQPVQTTQKVLRFIDNLTAEQPQSDYTLTVRAQLNNGQFLSKTLPINITHNAVNSGR